MQLVRFLFSVSRARILAVIVTGLFSGVANTYLLTLISGVLAPDGHTKVGVGQFAATAVVALCSALLSQVLLIRLTQDAIYLLRGQLSNGVVSAPLEQLERLGSHRLLATLTEDVRSLSQAVTAIPNLCVDVVTVFGCLGFLAVISGPIFAVMVGGTLVSIFGVELLLRRVRRLYREARESEDLMLRSFTSVTVGIKELKLHRGRREDFMDRHLLGAAGILRDQNVAAGSRFAVAHGYGRILQLITMAAILFGLASLLQLPREVMVSYILVTMYLSGPMQTVMQRIPELFRGDVALAKIRAMNLTMGSGESLLPYDGRPAATEGRLELTNVGYTYQSELSPELPSVPMGPDGPPGMGMGRRKGKGEKNGHPPHGHPPHGPGGLLGGPPPGAPAPSGPGFHLGPLDLVFEPGHITFIVGGNGSGKSTLAKILTGLYAPHTGFLSLNGEMIDATNVEWFRQNTSAIFTDFHLFEDYLGFNQPGLDAEVRHYLQELEIAHKVTVQDGKLSTVALSQGQRKRLALLTALLEDRSIYVFDEWAADQEPRFRDVFYTEILSGLKRRGKTVIVITHDDRYFHCADQLVKLDFGQIAEVTTEPFHAAIAKHAGMQ
ncbi:MAG: ATP-binding cassette domain-containing protein [Mycobacterium sp.]